MDQTKLILIIAGPTGVGKTDFALKIGSQIDSEIINADLGQFYTRLTIGTAKPDWKKLSPTHHLFDIIDQPKNFTVFEYRELILQKLDEIWSKKKLPILVGGSSFYIQSLLFPPQAKTLSSKKDANLIENKESLWQRLYEIDPDRALKIEKNDIYRINRALEIWNTTKIKPSEYVPTYNPPSNFILTILDRDRNELYQQIDSRVIEMINNGWIEEVKLLNSDWLEFLKTKKIIGYDDIILFLESYYDNDKSILIQTIQRKVRKYAKKQLTFLKGLVKKILEAEEKKQEKYAKKISWINLTLYDSDLYIKELINYINEYKQFGEK